jgi:hypothetical protein
MPFAVPATLAVVPLLLAGCSRGPRPPAADEGARSRATLDSATTARLCVPADSARVGSGACELRDQAPPPRPRPRP